LAAPEPGMRVSRYDRLRLEASEQLCLELRPEYDAIVGNYADALFALGKAIVAHEAFAKQNLPGVAWASLRPARMPTLHGNPAEETSTEIRQLLDWCVETQPWTSRKSRLIGNRRAPSTKGVSIE
jgi:hypothetical protein